MVPASNTVRSPLVEQARSRHIAGIGTHLIGIAVLAGLIWFVYGRVLDAP